MSQNTASFLIKINQKVLITFLRNYLSGIMFRIRWGALLPA